MNRFLLVAALLALLTTNGNEQQTLAGCHHLYRPAHHVAVVQPVTVLYSVGDSLVVEAAVEKALQRREALEAQKQTAPASVLSAKCARCHSGDSAKGGFDLSQGVNDSQFRRIVEMIGAGRNVPAEMKPVVSSLSPEQKGALTDELLNLKPQEGILK